MTNKEKVLKKYPEAMAVSDYNESDCWTKIYADGGEDGMGGEMIGWGQFEEDAWAHASKNLRA